MGVRLELGQQYQALTRETEGLSAWRCQEAGTGKRTPRSPRRHPALLSPRAVQTVGQNWADPAPNRPSTAPPTLHT